MDDADPDLLQRAFPVSHALLAHDDLMSRVLIRLFGPVHAVQTGLERNGPVLRRWSTLCQTATGAPLLQATLVIRTPSLAPDLVTRLMSSTDLFGGLLYQAGIAVRMTDRQLYRGPLSQPPAPGPASPGQAQPWGRRQRMLHAADGVLICDVDECLAPEADLRARVLPGNGVV